MDCAEILSRVRASAAAAESEPDVPDRAPKEPFALPSLSQPLPPTLARSWAQQPYVNTGLTVVEIGAVAGCGMLSDGAVVAFHRAGATLDWRDPTQNKPISWDDPIVLLSGEGEVLSSFGSDVGFVIPHGVFVDHTDCIWVTDCGLHQVFKFVRPSPAPATSPAVSPERGVGWGQDREGSLLLTLGAEGGPDPDKREQKDSDNADTSRFNKPADVSVDPVSGTVFVADGYGNSRVVAFDSSGGGATALRRNGRATVT